jgi:uncharacterized protein
LFSMDRFAPYVRAHRARQVAAEAELGDLCRRARTQAEAAATRLAEAFPVSRVVLFGSLERGAIHAGSDIDLFVEGLPEGSVLDAYAVASSGCELEVNVVPSSSAKAYIAEAVAREGVVLWPR